MDRKHLVIAACCMAMLTIRTTDGERRIPGCMYDCVGMQDDSYPSCNTCEEYVKCKDGKSTISHCPEGEHYDSKSQTCKDQDQADCVMYPDQDHELTSGETCIKSCKGLVDDDYQSCDGCNFFIRCKDEQARIKFCADSHQEFDDVAKLCVNDSTTCRHHYEVVRKECLKDQPRHIKKPTNFLYILADDLGYNDIGYHNPEFHTPYLDSLARSGRILDDLYFQPVCTPSRSAFMTGVLPHKQSMQHFVLAGSNPHCVPLDLKFLPEKLKEVGYRTHLFGKWHMGFCQWNCTANDRGFDNFHGMYGGQGDQYTHESQAPDPIIYDWRDNKRVDKSAQGIHTTDLITDRAITALRHHADHHKDQPFFMILTHTVPHHPLQAPYKYRKMFKKEKNEDRKMIKAMMAHLDDRTRDLVEVLMQQGLYDDTLIIFSSDNGGDHQVLHDNTPFRGGKGALFEGGTRVLGFVHGPMLKNAGPGLHTHHDGMIHVTDLHATIASMGGAKMGHIDGIDQTGMLIYGRGSRRSELIYNIDLQEPAYFGHAAYRDAQYKLIWGFPGFSDGYGLNVTASEHYPANIVELGEDPDNIQTDSYDRLLRLIDLKKFDPNKKNSGHAMLFDIVADPEERNDLSKLPLHKDRVLKMKAAILKSYREGYTAPPEESLQFWLDEAQDALEKNAWAPGWCPDLQLDRTVRPFE